MVPTKETAAAVSSATMKKVRCRMRSTDSPRLRALASPRRRVVSAQASFMMKGRHSSRTTAQTDTLVQVDFSRLPNSQKTICCSTSGEAMNCSNDCTDWKKNSTVMPPSTRISGEALRSRAMM